MVDCSHLARIIKKTGFRCLRCGTCRSPVDEDSNLVMVTPQEIRQIMDSFGLTWDDVAEPYPERIDDGMNHVYTLGWCIRRSKNECNFLDCGSCRIYQNRPWICRTYPFVLEGDTLRTYPCPGIGSDISWEDAHNLGNMLIQRQRAEACDEREINLILQNKKMPEEIFMVIDNEGIKPYPSSLENKWIEEIPEGIHK